MKRTLIALGLLFVSASASAQAPVPANSNAYREVLRIAQGVTFVDERTIERDDATARAWVLTVAAEDRTLPSGGVMRAGLTHYSFDCDARTSLPVRMAFVGPDLTVTETQVPDRPAAAIAAPLGDTLDLICGLRPACARPRSPQRSRKRARKAPQRPSRPSARQRRRALLRSAATSSMARR